MEWLLSWVGTLLGVGARFGLQNFLHRPLRLGPKVTRFDPSDGQYRGGPIYEVMVKKIVSGPYPINIEELADGSGDGLVFFHSKWKAYGYPIVGGYQTVDASKPVRGAIRFEHLQHNEQSFIFYVATERPTEYAYVDVRFTIQNENHRRKRILMRLPLSR